MKYATQITSPQPKGSPWKPGIHSFKTKREASHFTEGVNKNGKARTLVKLKSGQWLPAKL